MAFLIAGCDERATPVSPSPNGSTAHLSHDVVEASVSHNAGAHEEKGYIDGWFDGTNVRLYYTKLYFWFSESTRILLDQMLHEGVRRLVCVTGVGAGETKGHGGFLYDRVLYPLFTKGIYADKDRQEALIRQSRTDWTLVRPAPFRNRTPPGPLRVETQVVDVVLRKISPQEVATFLLDEAEHGRYIRQAVFIGHE